jgi:hypothetical protein
MWAVSNFSEKSKALAPCNVLWILIVDAIDFLLNVRSLFIIFKILILIYKNIFNISLVTNQIITKYVIILNFF